MLTGEPVPVDVGPGDPVTGATINTSGLLTVKALRVGSATRLAQIGRLVARAQTGKAPVQHLADRVSAVFVPVVLGLAIVTLLAWLLSGAGPQAAFTAACAVVIIACPCALGLATPTALLAGTGRGAQLGILIKGPEVLESTRRITAIALDKTGTVTEGKMSLIEVVIPTQDAPGTPAKGALAHATPAPSRALALRIAAAVEQGSAHPIAQAIARAGGEVKAATSFVSAAGAGAAGVVSEGLARPTKAAVGRPEFLIDQGMKVSDAVTHALKSAQDSGATAVLAGWGGAAQAVLVLRDEPKPGSAEAVSELRALGLRPLLLTGDSQGAALVAARQVGIAASDVIAGVQPEGKLAEIDKLKAGGAVVAMVGDGVNDAAALAAADLGMAMGEGTDVAIEAADITLVRGDLRSVPQAIRLSRQTLHLIKQNLFWAFAYNVAAIPLAAFGLLNPMIAGAAMAASSVIVVSNSLRLRRFDRHSGTSSAVPQRG
jgi:Cu+-exporting ATPase